MDVIAQGQLKAINLAQVRLAGPRYTPSLDASAPNLEIRAVAQAFDALGFTEGFRSRLRDLSLSLADQWADTHDAEIRS